MSTAPRRQSGVLARDGGDPEVSTELRERRPFGRLAHGKSALAERVEEGFAPRQRLAVACRKDPELLRFGRFWPAEHGGRYVPLAARCVLLREQARELDGDRAHPTMHADRWQRGEKLA